MWLPWHVQAGCRIILGFRQDGSSRLAGNNRLTRGYGSFVASLMHGAQVVIKPIQTFFHNWLAGRDMARVEEDMAFPRIGYAQ